MPSSPSTPNTGKDSECRSKMIGILGLCLASAACNTGRAEAMPSSDQTHIDQSKYDGCRTIIENDRVDIYCFLKEGERGLRKISQEQIEHANARNGERTSEEMEVLRRHGGHLFNMRRMPWIREECPTVMQKGQNGSPTKVYMNFPEVKKGNPRIVVFFHGNGGQEMKGKDTTNVIEFNGEMQRTGDPIILIAPQDGWGNFYPEGHEKNKPGNWRDYHNPKTFANLIDFAEGVMGKKGTNITLASFSGGNIGIMKLLKSMEASKEKDSRIAEIYRRIQRIAYFDSATGIGSQQVADWMMTNPTASVRNCYNENSQYNQGNAVLLETLIGQGVSSRRIHTEKMKFGYSGHGVFREYYKKFIAR